MSTPMSAVVKTACPPHLLSPYEMVMLPLEHFLQKPKPRQGTKPNQTKNHSVGFHGVSGLISGP